MFSHPRPIGVVLGVSILKKNDGGRTFQLNEIDTTTAGYVYVIGPSFIRMLESMNFVNVKGVKVKVEAARWNPNDVVLDVGPLPAVYTKDAKKLENDVAGLLQKCSLVLHNDFENVKAVVNPTTNMTASRVQVGFLSMERAEKAMHIFNKINTVKYKGNILTLRPVPKANRRSQQSPAQPNVIAFEMSGGYGHE
jgi:hypothetical protein